MYTHNCNNNYIFLQQRDTIFLSDFFKGIFFKDTKPKNSRSNHKNHLKAQNETNT